jgi:hypothetical protein
MSGARASLIWSALAVALAVPIGVAATSPLLAWRDPVYIGAGLAGVIALALLLVQPLLAGGYLPGLTVRRARQAHRALGIALVGAVAIHVAALWVTSPPDVIDALLLASPTPFSAWGVIAMWAVFAAALVAALRGRVRPRAWRIAHTALAGSVVVCSVVHAMLIEGTMGMISKTALCALALAAMMKVATRRRVR